MIDDEGKWDVDADRRLTIANIIQLVNLGPISFFSQYENSTNSRIESKISDYTVCLR